MSKVAAAITSPATKATKQENSMMSLRSIRGAASYIDRILRGAKAGDLPVQFADKYELVINLKTAKALGLDPPVSLLARTDEVIE
jgi:putative tryptophan/tyrosine transport system substrate-binding protein